MRENEMATEIQTFDEGLDREHSDFLDGLINERAAALFICFSVRTLQHMRGTGTGPKFYKLNRSIRYRRRDLLAFAEDRVRLSTSET